MCGLVGLLGRTVFLITDIIYFILFCQCYKVALCYQSTCWQRLLTAAYLLYQTFLSYISIEMIKWKTCLDILLLPPSYFAFLIFFFNSLSDAGKSNVHSMYFVSWYSILKSKHRSRRRDIQSFVFHTQNKTNASSASQWTKYLFKILQISKE